MQTKWLAIGFLGLGLVGAGCSMQKGEDKEGPEVKLTLDQVPAPIKATLTREADGAAFTSVDKETKDGKSIYETDAMIDGKNYEIKVAEDGSLISKKIDKEEDEKEDKGKDKD